VFNYSPIPSASCLSSSSTSSSESEDSDYGTSDRPLSPLSALVEPDEDISPHLRRNDNGDSGSSVRLSEPQLDRTSSEAGSIADKIKSHLGEGDQSVTLSRAKVKDLLLHLQTLDAGIELAEKDALAFRGLRYLLKLGDYAGRLCFCLRIAAEELGKPWPRSIVELLDELRAAEANGEGETLDTLGECLNILRHDGFDVDMEMVRVAIHAYARRNMVCHAYVFCLRSLWCVLIVRSFSLPFLSTCQDLVQTSYSTLRSRTRRSSICAFLLWPSGKLSAH
jgi:hypothetical protein